MFWDNSIRLEQFYSGKNKNVHIRGSNPYSGSKKSAGWPSWRLFATTIGVRPQNVNIFNFFYYRTVLDGWNGQIGALGVPGIAFGAVLGNGGVVVKCPDLAEFGRFYEIRRKRAWKAFQWGPVPPPEPTRGGLGTHRGQTSPYGGSNGVVSL